MTGRAFMIASVRGGGVAAAWLAALLGSAALADGLKPDILDGVYHLKTHVPASARTARSLGTEREGSAVLIDGNGLLVTVGYLLTEAESAEVTGNDGRLQPAVVLGVDQDTGLGLIRAEGLNTALVGRAGVRVAPIPLGSSADLNPGQTVLAASFGGLRAAEPVKITSRRDFPGGWEYLLANAIFTAPPHAAWSGAALIDKRGTLVGIGSLLLSNAGGTGGRSFDDPGNMFIPIDTLKPDLADLQSKGRPVQPHHPWLGLSFRERGERLVVTHVSSGSPAEKAGITPGAEILAVGGKPVSDLAGLYRQIWSAGDAGVAVPLTIMDQGARREVDVRSMDRYDYLKANSTF